MSAPLSCDIFCAVIDNFGDIGVSWRLAKQLADEQQITVRLWVDDLASFAKLCPELNVNLAEQTVRQISVRRWSKEDDNALQNIVMPDWVIEAFACKLPAAYLSAMAARKRPPLWINLEYLSAENWVESSHLLPSPNPRLPLTKYFFFPGFTAKTGGLLIENNLLAQRDAFQNSPAQQATFWQALNIAPRQPNELRVSLFSYENAALEKLLNAWKNSAFPLTCLVPEGKILPQLSAYFGQTLAVGGVAQRGNLRVQILPFVEQADYDRLLWACDINFVRGEDSCVRAQWAGKPFVWQIYPQDDGVHLTKLRALSQLWVADLPKEIAESIENSWLAWNGHGDIGLAWINLNRHRAELEIHAKVWAQKRASHNLTLNLLDFWRQVGRIRAFKN
jgi:uncharacterized repeat protein (TIGR03837 family)